MVARPLGVILAGGLSRRMGGGDKPLRTLGHASILHRVILRFAPQVEELALNANGDPGRFAEFGLPVVPDSVAGHPGPLAGVLAGLDWAASRGAEDIVTVAADTPFFPEDLLAQLWRGRAQAGTPIALAASRDSSGKLHRHPTFGLWPVALRDDLRAALEGGMRKVVDWTDAHGAATVECVDPLRDPFFNVNTPEDLATAEEMLG